MLFVPHGPRPLHEGRVSEWLRHETFAAQPPDVVPAGAVLQRAAENSSEFACMLQIAAGTSAPGINTKRAGEPQQLLMTL